MGAIAKMRLETSCVGQATIVVLLAIGLGLAMFKRTLDYDYIWIMPSCIFAGCLIGYSLEKLALKLLGLRKSHD
jgi:hypothetical protein